MFCYVARLVLYTKLSIDSTLCLEEDEPTEIDCRDVDSSSEDDFDLISSNEVCVIIFSYISISPSSYSIGYSKLNSLYTIS